MLLCSGCVECKRIYGVHTAWRGDSESMKCRTCVCVPATESTFTLEAQYHSLSPCWDVRLCMCKHCEWHKITLDWSISNASDPNRVGANVSVCSYYVAHMLSIHITILYFAHSTWTRVYLCTYKVIQGNICVESSHWKIDANVSRPVQYNPHSNTHTYTLARTLR